MAHFIGLINFLEGSLVSTEGAEGVVALGPLEIRATGPAAGDGVAEGSPVWLNFSRIVVMPF